MKKLIMLLFVATLTVQYSQAQEEKKESPFSFTADLKSNHLWRGLVITDKPMFAVYSSLKLNKKGSFTTGFLGGMSFSNESDGTSYKEINYYIQYSKGGLKLGLWDLFNTRGATNPNVWDYDKKTTGHILDFRSSYYFGEKLPLTLEVDMLLYGSADVKDLASGGIRQRKSTYMQVSYPLIKDAKVTVNGFVGAGFSLINATHLYGDGQNNFDIVNIGFTASKNVKLGDYNLPVSTTTFWNPSLKIARIQLAMTLF